MPPTNRSRPTPRHRPQHRRARQRSRLVRFAPVIGVAALVLSVVGVALGGVFNSPPASQPTSTTSSLPAGTTTVAPSSTAVATSTSTNPTTTSAPTTTTLPPTTVPVPATVAPADVLVEVLNGMGQSGAAAAAATDLQAEGFVINGTGDASSFSHVASIVAYPPGGLTEANTVAARIKGAVTLQEDSSIPSNEVDLVVGSSFAGVTA